MRIFAKRCLRYNGVPYSIGQELEVENWRGREWIDIGLASAEPAEPVDSGPEAGGEGSQVESIDDLTKKQLVSLADQIGVPENEYRGKSKAELVELIEGFEAAARASDPDPDGEDGPEAGGEGGPDPLGDSA